MLYGLLTKRKVKMTGYWPSSFFATRKKKKRTRPKSSQLDRERLANKGFSSGFRGIISRGTRRVVASVQDGSILHAWVSDHSARFASSCPLMITVLGCHIISYFIEYSIRHLFRPLLHVFEVPMERNL